MIGALLLLVGVSMAADSSLAPKLRKAEAQLAGGEARRALRTADKVHSALAQAPDPLSPAQRSALDKVRSQAHALLSEQPGEDAAHHLDRAAEIRAACREAAQDPDDCGPGDRLARALRARAAKLQRAMLQHTGGASAAESRNRCEQAAATAPSPPDDARCLAVLSLATHDLELARKAGALALSATPAGDPAADEAVAAAAQVVGYENGHFAEALTLVEGILQAGDAPKSAVLAEPLRSAIARLVPKHRAMLDDPEAATPRRAWLLALDQAGLDRLAVHHARQALEHSDPAVLEAAGVALFNAAARAKKADVPAPTLRGWLADATAAFERCDQAGGARCAERAQGAKTFHDALPR